MTRRTALCSLAVGFGLSSGKVEGIAREPERPSVEIEDEFAPLKTAIVHDASNAIDINENLLQNWGTKGWVREHPETGKTSSAEVMKEIANLRKLLRSFGVEILAPEPVEGAYCQAFTRDQCFAIDKTLFLGVLAGEHRKPEIRGLAKIRERYDSAIDLDEGNATIEGGDVMVLDRGRRVLVGTHENTNEAGFLALSRHLKNQGIEPIEVSHRMLHLDCCLAPLPDGSALFVPWRFPKTSMATLKRLFKKLTPLDKEESSRQLAANLLWLDPENVVSGARSPRTNAKLRAMGYKVHAIDFTHVKRMWGSFRCTVCPLKRG